MAIQDISVFGDKVELIERRTSSYGGAELKIDITNVDVDSILSDIGIEEAINYFEEDELLEKIGKDKAIEYFAIEEKE